MVYKEKILLGKRQRGEKEAERGLQLWIEKGLILQSYWQLFRSTGGPILPPQLPLGLGSSIGEECRFLSP